jgi:hypothetical protein
MSQLRSSGVWVGHAVFYKQSAPPELVIRVIPSGQLSFIVNPEDQKTPLFPFFHIIHHSSFKIQHSSSSSLIQNSKFNIPLSSSFIQHSTFKIQHSSSPFLHSKFKIQNSTFPLPLPSFNIQNSKFNIPPPPSSIQHSKFKIQHSSSPSPSNVERRTSNLSLFPLHRNLFFVNFGYIIFVPL